MSKKYTWKSKEYFKKKPKSWIYAVTLTQHNPFHVVTRSPWPFYVSWSIGMLVIDFVRVFQRVGPNVFCYHGAFIFLICFLFMWFHDIIIESITGHHTKKVAKSLRLGFFLMILSEIMFFFSFFWSLFHYTLCLEIWGGEKWPFVEGVPPGWGTAWVGTLFLIVSSWWISEAKVQFLWGNLKSCMYCIFSTLWCGSMFLIIQREEFLSTSLTINNSCTGGIFFLLTGFHCLHVIIGMIFIISLYIRFLRNKNIFVKQKAIMFDITIWYWHFVDYVWIFLFFVLYLYLGSTQ